MSHRPGPFHEVDAPVRDYKDLRSAAKSRKRGRDQYHKYVKYGNVTRGQANVPHYVAEDRWTWPSAFVGCEVRPRLSKRDFYLTAREAQICRHHGPCPGKKDSYQKQWVAFKRGSVDARREAQGWTASFQDLAANNWNEGMNGAIRYLIGDGSLTMSDWIMGNVPDDEDDDFEPRQESYIEAEQDSASIASSDDWSEVESIASWDDFFYITTQDDCCDDIESLWTEIEAE